MGRHFAVKLAAQLGPKLGPDARHVNVASCAAEIAIGAAQVVQAACTLSIGMPKLLDDDDRRRATSVVDCPSEAG